MPLAWKKASTVNQTGFYVLCNLESDEEFPDTSLVLVGRNPEDGKLFATAYGNYRVPLTHYDNEFFIFLGPIPPAR